MVAERVADRPRLHVVDAAPRLQVVDVDELARVNLDICHTADDRRRTLLNRRAMWPLCDDERQQLIGLDVRLDKLWLAKRQLLAARGKPTRRRIMGVEP